jgi:hypothetical protein
MILKQHGRLPEDIEEKVGLTIRDYGVVELELYTKGIQMYIIYPYISGAIK